MKKSSVKRNSPQPLNLAKHFRNSVKENKTVRLTPCLNVSDYSRVLVQKNETDLTERANSRSGCKRNTESRNNHSNASCFSNAFSTFRGSSPASDSNRSARENILQIRESILQILDESVQTTTQIKKLKEKLETNCSIQNNSAYRPDHPEFDESSIHSPSQDQSFFSHIQDLKSQLSQLNSKLSKREEKIREKHVENLSLHFQIFSLSHKLEKLRSKSLKKTKICEIF